MQLMNHFFLTDVIRFNSVRYPLYEGTRLTIALLSFVVHKLTETHISFLSYQLRLVYATLICHKTTLPTHKVSVDNSQFQKRGKHID